MNAELDAYIQKVLGVIAEVLRQVFEAVQVSRKLVLELRGCTRKAFGIFGVREIRLHLVRERKGFCFEANFRKH